MKDRCVTRWNDVKTMLADWLAWLDEIQPWAEATAASGHSGDDRQAGWPMNVSDVTAASTPAGTDTSHAETLRPDLFALLSTMTSLRQEVNLQTRSARHDREQASQTLEQLTGLVTEIERERQEADRRRVTQETDYVHLDALLELHEALSRAERQASQLIASTVTVLRDWSACQNGQEHRATDGATENGYPGEDLGRPATAALTLRWFRRWFGRSTAFPVDESEANACEPVPTHAWRQMRAEATRMADRLEGLLTGYQLSLQRLERLLSGCGIEPVSCLGQPVEPEFMEVVQIASDTALPPGTVTDEIRQGYRRHGQMYRFAQVVATRSVPRSDRQPEDDATPMDAAAPVDDMTDETSGQP